MNVVPVTGNHFTWNAQTCEKTSHGELKQLTDVLSMYQYNVADSVENYWFSVLTEMCITEMYVTEMNLRTLKKACFAADVIGVRPNLNRILGCHQQLQWYCLIVSSFPSSKDRIVNPTRCAIEYCRIKSKQRDRLRLNSTLPTSNIDHRSNHVVIVEFARARTIEIVVASCTDWSLYRSQFTVNS